MSLYLLHTGYNIPFFFRKYGLVFSNNCGNIEIYLIFVDSHRVDEFTLGHLHLLHKIFGTFLADKVFQIHSLGIQLSFSIIKLAMSHINLLTLVYKFLHEFLLVLKFPRSLKYSNLFCINFFGLYCLFWNFILLEKGQDIWYLFLPSGCLSSYLNFSAGNLIPHRYPPPSQECHIIQSSVIGRVLWD